uniref:Wsv115-like protein n=1 Tax=Melicertus latisulcatus pemonivirus TaxID=2984278 RepID=A0A9C7BHX7_9VIRU|nr:MAG: wsv115-like protein [Melicertus latisulcatus pemonivirus]
MTAQYYVVVGRSVTTMSSFAANVGDLVSSIPASPSRSSPFTPADHEYAITYAKERLRQEAIFRKRQEEPGPYSFVEIQNLGIDGWRSKLGIPIEPGQKLAPYRHITYDREKVNCQDFSCIPLDPRKLGSDPNKDDQPQTPSLCNFAEGTQVGFSVIGRNNEILRQFTACGPGCYRFTKKRDPGTGMPLATGTLIDSHVDSNGRPTCRYLNSGLIMWAGLPVTRQGTLREGFNTDHVPPFAFGEANLQTLHLTESYCRFFKQYFDPDSGECYRTGWMRTVRFLFGTYFTNVTYELGSLSHSKSPFLNALGRALYGAGAARAGEAVPFTVDHLDLKSDKLPRLRPIVPVPPTIERPHEAQESYSDMTERIVQSHFKPFLVDSKSAQRLVSDIVEYVSNNEVRQSSAMVLRQQQNNNNDKKKKWQMQEEATNKLTSALFDTAFRIQVMGVPDSKARSILLRELLANPNTRRFTGGLGSGVRLVGFVLKLREVLFSDEASERRRNRRQDGDGETTTREKVSDLDALRFAKLTFSDPVRRESFLDVFSLNREGDISTVDDIWRQLESRYLAKPARWIGSHIRGIVVNMLKGVLDIVKGKVFEQHYDLAKNIPLYIGIDRLIQSVFKSASRTCMKFVAQYSAETLATRANFVLAERVLTDVASRTFGLIIEESVIRMVVSSAIKLAIEIFVKLAEIAVDVIDVVGWILLVGAILGLVLDLALHLQWYEDVMTQQQLESYVRVYEAAFADATETELGSLAPVTPEELLSISVSWDRNLIDHPSAEKSESTLDQFLDCYFEESPVQGKTTSAFLQEAQFEYLGSRTVNSLGQPIHGNRARQEEQAKHMSTIGRNIMVETATGINNFARVAQYNTSRLDYLRHMGSVRADKRAARVTKLTEYGIGCTAVGVAVLAVTLGHLALAASKESFRLIDIAVSLSFAGLFVFVVLCSLTYTHFYVAGVENARAAKAIVEASSDSSDDSALLSAGAATVAAGAKVDLLSSFMTPYLEKVVA